MRNAPPEPELLTDGSEPMGAVLRELDLVAQTSLTVLILGPSGSGKELAARELHRRSGRSGPLVPVNCAALAEGALESELFGHVRGAFTGADRDRPGALVSASGGTVFLDEVADLSARTQAMLLRVLQESEIRPLGSDRWRPVNLRFVAATNQPLEEMVRTRLYREDLLHRLQGSVLVTPALAERGHEFHYLVPRLVERISLALGRNGPPLEPGLCEALAAQSWPGNVRQLLHCLERALLRCGKGPLGSEHFPELAKAPGIPLPWQEATLAFQRRHLLESLGRRGFHAAETARDLGLSRTALYATARRLGVDLAQERRRKG
ncbi:sigma 54-interacting transcriptional regulator [Geothrix sp. 21YS21S-2]|uniref:sigma 54-interacting transcriptional regulator n=1 Tax=Geothrix sp. 21YS21S-2 TaxID=3068893 RepID=UPI0027BAC0DA|nr:sigma 54-interacting transcriptional regulator [Geothrix sp. 21YS21S-2]